MVSPLSSLILLLSPKHSVQFDPCIGPRVVQFGPNVVGLCRSVAGFGPSVVEFGPRVVGIGSSVVEFGLSMVEFGPSVA